MDYKKYSLENLENWMHDAMSSAEATPQEIYDVIVGAVKENYYYYKQQTSQAYELLSKLNGHPTAYNWLDKKENLSCDKDDSSPECKGAWNDFWEDSEDKVVKWRLPVELDGLTGECYVQFPDDLLEAANLQEGDTVNWIDNNNGSFTLKKVTKPLGMDEC
jgi:hypothetical protein